MIHWLFLNLCMVLQVSMHGDVATRKHNISVILRLMVLEPGVFGL